MGNGNFNTMGRIQTLPGVCLLEKPTKMLTKPPGICEERMNKAKITSENRSWWEKVSNPTSDEEIDAKLFKQSCEKLPQQVPESYIDSLWQRLNNYLDGKTPWLPAEEALEIRQELGLLEDVFRPGPRMEAPLTEAEQEFILSKKNDLEFALLGIFSGPGRFARALGLSEQRVAEANMLGYSTFEMASASFVESNRPSLRPSRSTRTAPSRSKNNNNSGVFVAGPGEIHPKWRGPLDYSKIAPQNVKNGADFTRATKRKIYELNKETHDGYLVSDQDGTILVEPQKSKSGVKPSPYEAQVDHIKPRAKGGDNSGRNARVLSRKQNRDKSDKYEE